jgi:hypothetical protein
MAKQDDGDFYWSGSRCSGSMNSVAEACTPMITPQQENGSIKPAVITTQEADSAGMQQHPTDVTHARKKLPSL